MKTTQDKKPDSDRRNYFRLEDKVYIEYALVNQVQAAEFTQQQVNQPQARDDDNLYLDALTRQITTLTTSLRGESSVTVQAVELLNRKIDYIAGILFFDKFRTSSGDGKGVRTSTVDISEGGMSFNARNPLDMNQYMRLRVVIVSARLGIETVGKVVSCHEKQHKDMHYYRIGVEFPKLHEADRRALARYIMDKQREQIRANSKPSDWDDVQSPN